MNLFKAYILILIYISTSVILIFFIPSIVLASSADGKAMEGMALYKKKAFEQASQKFLDARRDKPNDSKIIYNLGNSHYKQGKFKKALQAFSNLLNQKSDSAIKQKSVYNLGNTLFRMDKLEESIAAYKKALDLDPNDMDAKFNLEFARKKSEKKKEERQKKNKSDKDKKNKDDKNQQNQTKNQGNSNNPLNQQKPPFQDKQEQDNFQDNSSAIQQALQENMTKEEAEQKLSALTEDLKKFQRKQALDMRSIFTYQGNDW